MQYFSFYIVPFVLFDTKQFLYFNIKFLFHKQKLPTFYFN